MNRTQQRLCSYRLRHGSGELTPPVLARGATPEREGERAAFDVERDGFAARVSVPRRPRGWVMVAGEDEGLAGLERTGYATVRLGDAGDGPSSGALLAAARWLAALPEARGLAVAIAGAGDRGRRAAVEAAAALGPAAGALVLDGECDGPVAILPTLVLADQPAVQAAERIESFLDAELGLGSPPALNHRQRRLLARRLERGMRAECRRSGRLTGRVRAGLAALAATLAFTLSMGLGAAPAEATFTTSYVTATGQLSLTDLGTSAGATLDCDTAAGSNGGEVLFDDGSGPVTPTGPGLGGALDCVEVVSITVSGGGGADTVELDPVVLAEYSNLIDGVTIDGGLGTDDLDAVSDRATTIAGGGGNDTISGSSVGDSIAGNANDDSIAAQGGTDVVDYSGSAAGVNANLGAGTGTGEGTDTLSGVENAIGTGSGDTLTAAAGGSSLRAGAGTDSLAGAGGVDTLLGEGQDDTIDGAGGVDTLDGGADRDEIAGGTGVVADTLSGAAGSDTLDGEAGADSVLGGTEDDQLVGDDTANDTLNGEAGNDTADYTGAGSAVDIDLNTDSATGAGTDTLTLIENATGSAQADTIDGDGAANTLAGLAGADTINGNAGNDSIQGNGDADTINAGGSTDTANGGAGNDTIDAATGIIGQSESLVGGTENDSLSAITTNGSTIAGDAGLDTIFGSNNVDSIDAGADADTVDANGGNDTVSGGTGIDTLLGDGDNDSVLGGDQGDTLDGRFGLDTLSGDGGDDTMVGNDANDSIAGGTGTLDRVQQGSFSNQTLTDTQLTGQGTDTLSGVERASLEGDGVLDASAFSGAVTLDAAGGGTDTLRGAAGDDSLIASDATDRVEQTANANQTLTDTQLTGDGTDTLSNVFRVALTAGAGNNDLDASAWSGVGLTLDGQAGNDTLRPGTSGTADSLVGGAAGTDRLVQTRDQSLTLSDALLTAYVGAITLDSDTLSGFEQASLTGGSGGNDLDASAFTGVVTLDAGDSGDTVAGATGSDSLIGGGFGTDLVEQTANANQTLTDTQLTGDGTDTLSGVEQASLAGGASANTINASAFTLGTTLAGLAGNDTLLGGNAHDRLEGGTETDRVVQTGDVNHTLTDTLLTSGTDQDTLVAVEQASLTGGASNNNLSASAFTLGPVSLVGLGGDDFMLGSAASDSIDGGAEATAAGDQTTQTANADQTLTDTQLTGAGTDTIAELEQASLNGGAAANDLEAGGFSGRVQLFGDAGNDTLAGAAGNDQLLGGADTDRVEQIVDADQTLTNTQLTGDGLDALDQVEHASLVGGVSANTLDGSAFTNGPTTLAGLGGNDSLAGGSAADSLDGGTENDSLSGGAGTDTLDGAAGSDLADYFTVAGALSIDLGAQTVTGAATDDLDGIEQAQGGTAADTLTGSAAPDSLFGGSGGDVLNAQDGADSLSGEDGTDSLNGQGGNDQLDGGALNDTLQGDAGGGAVGNDTITGGSGTGDRLVATLATGSTSILLSNAQVTGSGTDSLADQIETALLAGNGSANVLAASDGASVASAYTGIVTVDGGAGNDTLRGGAADDSLVGGSETDRIEQLANGNQTLTGTALTATGMGTDAHSGIEQASLRGEAGADQITATAFTGTTTLDGGAGADTLLGSPQADHLSGGTGTDGDSLDGAGGSTDRVTQTADADQTLTDTLLSGQGSDTLVAVETASLTGGAAANSLDASAFTLGSVTVDGQGGNDSLFGSEGGDSLLGQGENDAMRGGAGSDNLSGGTGTNTADFSDDPGGTGIQANLATGQVQNASTDTLSGVQVVIGTSFADALTGDGAANTLIGGAGGDTITGGGGQDSLRGETGNDTHNSQDGGTVDSNDCGADTDTANADTQDTNVGCETVNNTEPEPPPPPPPGPDTKAPAIDLSGKGKQKDKKQVKVDVSCDEACAVEAAGTIKVPKQDSKGRFKSSKKFDLKGASADLAAGQAQTLKLKLTSTAKKLLKKAIKEKKSTAKVTATGTDAAGNSATSSTFKVKVKK